MFGNWTTDIWKALADFVKFICVIETEINGN